MRRALVSAFGLALSAVLLTANASSGNGISMRTVRGGCVPVCAGDREPAWSPDGKTIAFIRRTPQDIRLRVARAIYAVPAAGGAVRRVTAPNRQRAPDALAWSPDSTRLAFRTTGGVNYVVPAAGGTPVPIRPPPNAAPSGYFLDSRPVWSPDGRWLAFVRFGADRFAPRWCCQLWIAAADGSSARSLGGAAPAEWLGDPAWSPDGRLAFVTGPRDIGGYPDLSRAEIWVMDADGSGRRKLVAAAPDQRTLNNLSWSSDGSRLSYAREISSYVSLQWVSADGTQSGPVAWFEKDLQARCCWFSPDGTSAVVATPGSDGGMDLLVSRSVLKPRRIANGISAQSRPLLTTASWSPDGLRVAYVSDGECAAVLAIHTVRIDGSDARRLTLPCRISGTPRGDSLRGRPRADALYGRGGNDRIDGAGGADFLQGGFGSDRLSGGAGDDRLYGGPGADRLNAGAGWDAVYSRDEAADVIHCGSGDDTVWADSKDRVARDCELTVRR
jgi:Tol biopolymer transport system component